MTALIVFVSTFVSVFALGFQSQNVNQGHYLSAFLTSFAIGGGTLVLYKQLPSGGTWEIAGYLLGGALGITASMWAHRRTLGKARPTPAENPLEAARLKKLNAELQLALLEVARVEAAWQPLLEKAEAMKAKTGKGEPHAS